MGVVTNCTTIIRGVYIIPLIMAEKEGFEPSIMLMDTGVAILESANVFF